MRWHNKNKGNQKWRHATCPRYFYKAIRLFLCVGISLGLENVAAQALPERIVLEEFLQLVARNNLELQADRMQIDAAHADLQTASAFPNPVVSHSKKPGEKETAIEQPLPIFGQRGLRMEGARLGIKAASARVDASRATSLHEAAQHFITLLIAQEKYAQRKKAEAQMDAAWHIVRGQVDAGARSRYEQVRIDVERTDTQMQTAQAASEMGEAMAKVAAAAGAPNWRPIASGSLQPSRELATFDVAWEKAKTQLPAVRAAMAEQALAQKMVEVEKREAWPTPAIGIGKLRDSDGRHSVLGVTVEIPLFDRRSGAIAKARAESREASLRRDAVIRNAENELRRATSLLAERIAISQRFREKALARLPELYQMAQDAYTMGEGNVWDLIDSIQSVAEKQMTWLELMEAVLQAELDVRFASGDMPSMPDTTANITEQQNNRP